MNTYFLKLKTWIAAHRALSIVILIVVIGAGYFGIKKLTAAPAQTNYVLGTLGKGTIISAISGTGQVSASNQVDLSAKTSGDLIYLNAKVGQKVSAGTLIGQIDSTDATYELESAQLAYQDLVTVDPNDLRKAQDALTEAQTNRTDAYASARATLTSNMTNMADAVSGLGDLFDGYLSTNTNNAGVDDTGKEYLDKAQTAYDSTSDALTAFQKKYQTINSATNNADIELFIAQADTVSNQVSEAAKYAEDAVVYLRNREDPKNKTRADDAYASVVGLVSSSNAIDSSLSSAKNSFTTTKTALDNAQADLDTLQAGPKQTDLRSNQLSIKQKQEDLDNHFIRAPFDGVIASVSAQKGDTVSSGTAIATLITEQKIAEISLNEIDAAKVSAGQKVTLTFDAIDGLSIAGSVAEVDLIGTVTQGVVNYTVKIGFDTDDERIKPGMTVSANIITAMKQDVLVVPTTAVKTVRGVSTILVPNETIPAEDIGKATGVPLMSAPESVEVTLGLANDDSVEVVSGLDAGATYVVRMIAQAVTKTATTAAPSLLGGGAAGGRAAGGFGGGAGFGR